MPLGIPQTTFDILLGAAVATVATVFFNMYDGFKRKNRLRQALIVEIESIDRHLNYMMDMLELRANSDPDSAPLRWRTEKVWTNVEQFSTDQIGRYKKQMKTNATDDSRFHRELEVAIGNFSKNVYKSNAGDISSLTKDEIHAIIHFYRMTEVVERSIRYRSPTDIQRQGEYGLKISRVDSDEEEAVTDSDLRKINAWVKATHYRADKALDVLSQEVI